MVDPNKYLIDLSEKLCPLVWDAPLSELSKPEQVFVCVYEVERELNNGGFDQFFRNSPGQYAAETVLALDEIGATLMAATVRAATELVFTQGEVPADQDERNDLLDDVEGPLEEKLAELDARFLEYPENLTRLL